MAAKNQKTTNGQPPTTISVGVRLDKAVNEADHALAEDKSDIVLDFSGCTFITVDGLEWLEELLLRAESKKHEVRFNNITPTIYKVFKVSHIDSILKACGAPASTMGPVC